MPELRRCRSLLPAYAKINRLLPFNPDYTQFFTAILPEASTVISRAPFGMGEVVVLPPGQCTWMYVGESGVPSTKTDES